MTVQEKFAAARRDIARGLIEREHETDLALTALLAREHCLLVGPPGTAKSMLSRAVVSWIGEGRTMELLLGRFSTPEEVFGPISLSGLKDDRYRRVLTGRLADVHVAFVDEIFKASTAILNTLLTVLNERQYDNDGMRVDAPLELCVAASNEWPGGGEDGARQELGALFDRFVLRGTVRPVATERGLQRLLWGTVGVVHTTSITPAEIRTAQAEAAALEFSDEAVEAFRAILTAARNEGICPGDRRLRKAVSVCRAFAYLCGGSDVRKDHLEILADVLWDDPAEQPGILAGIVGKIANPARMRVNSLVMEAEGILSGLVISNLDECVAAVKKLQEIAGKLAELDGPAEEACAHVKSEIKRIRLATVEAM